MICINQNMTGISILLKCTINLLIWSNMVKNILRGPPVVTLLIFLE